jgi:hypothetical protein
VVAWKGRSTPGPGFVRVRLRFRARNDRGALVVGEREFLFENGKLRDI